jgi:hypothetical protein
MFFSKALLFLASAGVLEAAAPLEHFRRQSGSGDTCIASNLIQGASGLTGQESGTEGIKDGQAESLTDKANFINFCQGKTVTNGEQNTAGSCNPIPMGDIPSTNNMVSAVITNPKFGQTFGKNESFTITVQTAHLDAGSFTNPTTTYYTAPQQLNANGDIIGHCHVTVQDLGDFNTQTPPDANQKAFFLGIDDAGNGQGLLSADVSTGLLPGNYRVCTMIAAMNHQPVNMPIAQRGAQDDCVRFRVVDGAVGGGPGGPGGPGGNSTAPTRRRFTI